MASEPIHAHKSEEELPMSEKKRADDSLVGHDIKRTAPPSPKDVPFYRNGHPVRAWADSTRPRRRCLPELLVKPIRPRVQHRSVLGRKMDSSRGKSHKVAHGYPGGESWSFQDGTCRSYKAPANAEAGDRVEVIYGWERQTCHLLRAESLPLACSG